MALPNSYYSWVYQLLWGLKYFLVSLGTKEVVEKNIGTKYDTWFSQFLGLKGPYLLLQLEHSGSYVMICEIIVDGESITPPVEGENDGMTLAGNQNYVGRDGVWKPFILATKTLEIKTRAKLRYGEADIFIKVMRFGE